MRFPLIHTKYNVAFNEYIFYLTNFWYLGIVGVVVIAKRGDETFAFSLDLFTWIRNRDNKHTAIVRCIYESLIKSHASFDSYKESMRYITDVSRLSCNSFAEPCEIWHKFSTGPGTAHTAVRLSSYDWNALSMNWYFVSNLAASKHRQEIVQQNRLSHGNKA